MSNWHDYTNLLEKLYSARPYYPDIWHAHSLEENLKFPSVTHKFKPLSSMIRKRGLV